MSNRPDDAALTQHLEHHLEILDAVQSVEDWNEALSEVLIFWMVRGHGGLLFNEARARLTERVRAGFKAPRHAPQLVLQARSDANLLLRNMRDGSAITINGQPAQTIVRTLADAVRCIASVERIPAGLARQRAIRAEEVLGFKLPREPKGFSRKPQT
jgi:hypothetical protein